MTKLRHFWFWVKRIQYINLNSESTAYFSFNTLSREKLITRAPYISFLNTISFSCIILTIHWFCFWKVLIVVGKRQIDLMNCSKITATILILQFYEQSSKNLPSVVYSWVDSIMRDTSIGSSQEDQKMTVRMN